MARRRKKKQADSLTELLAWLVILPAIYTWLETTSFFLAFIVFIIPFVIIILILRIRKNRREQRLMQSGIYDIDKMKGVQFEQYLSVLFKSLGYESTVTKASGDYGADLILIKNNKKIVIQAKRYSKNIGIRAVQEIRAAKDHYQANEAWVVSNQAYTRSAIELSKTSNVKLIGREQLIEMILQKKEK